MMAYVRGLQNRIDLNEQAVVLLWYGAGEDGDHWRVSCMDESEVRTLCHPASFPDAKIALLVLAVQHQADQPRGPVTGFR